jgi:ABC-type glycerol-3-phosphate transport system permease component
VDGARGYRVFWSIARPDLRPGLATLRILFALESWDDLVWPLIALVKQEDMPLAVGLAAMVDNDRVQSEPVLAGSVLATVPIILLCLLLRRQSMEGAAFTAQVCSSPPAHARSPQGEGSGC